MKATIDADDAAAPTTFVQTWKTRSREHQDGLLETMRRQVGALRSQPGFVSMSLHRSDDGQRVVVYAQWRSAAELAAAVATDAARAGHDELVKWGEADGGATYGVADVFGPTTANENREGGSVLRVQARRRWEAVRFATRMVSLGNLALHVADSGEGDDAVILLHGYPQSGEIWRAVAPMLRDRHRVIIPDLRGMGLSEAPPDRFDLVSVAEDLHALVAALGLPRVKVVGHDWGGSVGAVWALRHRDEVTRLAVLESALPGAGFESLWNFATPNDRLTFIPFLLMGQADRDTDITLDLVRGRESAFLRYQWQAFTGDPEAAPFSAWAPYVAAMERPEIARGSTAYYRAAYESATQVKALLARKLQIPVLAVAGEKGMGANHAALVRAFAENIVDNLILPGAGHFLAEERPRELAALLLAFLTEPTA